MNQNLPFEDTVLKTCIRLNLFPKGSRVLLALSGGPDSTALFHALNKLLPTLGILLGVAHLNHQMRGEESAADALFVQRLAEKYDAPYFVKEVDMKRWLESEGYSFQEGARIYRKNFLENTASQHGFDFIATGHTEDDQAETVLMNIMRGTGALGLAGIPSKRGLWVRPMIHCSRQEVMAYLTEIKSEFRVDSSNQNLSYLRNKVRLKLIPELEQEYSPALRSHLSKLASLIQDDESCLSEIAQKVFEDCRIAGSAVPDLEVKQLQGIPVAIVSRVLRLAIKEIKGDLKRVDFDHIRQLTDLVNQPGVDAIVLPGDIKAWREAGFIKWAHLDRTRSPKTECEKTESVFMKVPGQAHSLNGRILFKATVETGHPADIRLAKTNQAYMDLDSVGETITVRGPGAGDTFWPLGAPGSKKLKSYLIDRKIPKESRSDLPILTGPSGDVIWVYGHQISETVKVRPETRNILCLEGFE